MFNQFRQTFTNRTHQFRQTFASKSRQFFSRNPLRVYASIGSGVFGGMMAANMVSTLANRDKRTLMTSHPFLTTSVVFAKSAGTGLLWPALGVSFVVQPINTLTYATTSFNMSGYLSRVFNEGGLPLDDIVNFLGASEGASTTLEMSNGDKVLVEIVKENGKVVSRATRNGIVVPNAVCYVGDDGWEFRSKK